MVNYEKGEGLSDEDSKEAMVVIEDDLVTFEEAIKSKTWRNAMEREMRP